MKRNNALPPALYLLNVLSVLANIFVPGTSLDDQLKAKRLEKFGHDIAGVDARAAVSRENKVAVMLRQQKLEMDIELRKEDIRKRKLECLALEQQLGILRKEQEFHPEDYDGQEFDPA